MHDHSTTPGSPQPDVEQLPVIEQVLIEAAQELPAVTLAGCLTVAAETLPYALGIIRPVCSYQTNTGSHPIPTPFVWKDLETDDVYCRLYCAALDAIERARTISDTEGLLDRLSGHGAAARG